MIKQAVIKKGTSLIITAENQTNNSLSNKELLKTAINNTSQSIKRIIINSKYLRKEYDSELINESKRNNTLDPISDYLSGRKELERTKIIKQAKELIKKGMTPSEIYNQLLMPKITPKFITSEIKTVPKNLQIINSYHLNNSVIKIRKKGTEMIYSINPEELNCDYETIKRISETIKEIETMELKINSLNNEINELLNKKELSNNEKEIILRHTIGFGLLEIIFKDPKVEDIYVYSKERTVHINHKEHGNCKTNLLITKRNIEELGTKLRIISGRPFDESFPVIDYELSNYGLRVCGVKEPLTFKGTGYAFRKHNTTPWQLTDLINNKTVSSQACGLLNFLIDSQCSILITGPRGSGKTALLTALINEIPKNNRIIIIEDTPEIPVKELIKKGYTIEHLRVKPHLKTRSTDYELTASEALRTSLRLGESVLIIGEVRGTEAKALFEAMRVGAAGNAVLGTIHGSTPYDTFDRIVNDLKVPPTSFKAADIIISCANLRRGEEQKTDRTIISITEVKKNWKNEPQFNELTKFNREKREITLSPRIRNSEIMKRIAQLKGISINECINSIRRRAKEKEKQARKEKNK